MVSEMNHARIALILFVGAVWSDRGHAAMIDTASVVLPSIPGLTSQGLPNTQLGKFSFTVSTQVNPVNNDAVNETVYNLRADAAEQYSTQYYPCAARGGGCSTIPTTIIAQQTATGISPQAFVVGEQATAQFTFSYIGSLKFNVAATNMAFAESYSLALAASDGKEVSISDPLNGTYTLSLSDPSYSRGAVYVITTLPNGTSGVPVTPSNSGSPGDGSPGSGTSSSIFLPGTTGPEGGNPSMPVPEPSSALILAISLHFCAAARKRRSKCLLS